MTDHPSPRTAPGTCHRDALPVGTRLAEFEIQALLGVGGFGMVYRAFDHSLHRAVAIKEYMPSALAGRAEGLALEVRTESDRASFQAGLASFVAEARLLAQFDHPSLVKVFRFWEAHNTAYMVMPLYSGMTLKQARTQMRTPPPEAWLRKVLWSVLGALRVLHDGQTLHRDISPDNIFLQDLGPPVLLDLGAARHAINDQDRRHTAVLKVNYAPIEQYAEADDELRQGPWSDLYSLAAVVHGCLCNDTPLPATLRSIRDRMVPFARVAKTVRRQFGVEYSPPFVAAISAALQLQPQDRPASIDAFLAQMQMTTAPEGLDHFDFRAELGELWLDAPAVGEPLSGLVEAGARSTPHSIPWNAAQATTVVVAPEADIEDTRVLEDPRDAADTVLIDVGDRGTLADGADNMAAAAPAPVVAAAPAPRTDRGPSRRAPSRRSGGGAGAAASTRRRSALGWWAVGMLVLVVSAAVLWAVAKRPHGAAPRPADDIITELADPPRPLGVPAASAAVVTEASDASAMASGPAAAPAASTVALPASAAGVASAPQAAPAAFVVASGPRGARAVPARKASAEPAVLPPPPPVVAEAPPAPEPPPPPPRPKPAPPRPPSPEEACADASFLARPLCIHQECQKPAVAAHPVCVEARRRFEAEQQRRQMAN